MRAHEYIITITREIRLTCTLDFGQMLYLLIDEHLYLLGVDSQLLEDEGCNVLGLRDYSFQYVCRFYNLLAVHLCGVHRLLNRLLCFDCKLLEIHILLLSFFAIYPSIPVPKAIICQKGTENVKTSVKSI